MTGRWRYMAASAALVTLAVGASWALLGYGAATMVLVAGLVALPVQAALFTLLDAAHGDDVRFMKAWGTGMAVRVGCVATVGAVSVVAEVSDPAIVVLSTAGFLFVLHLLEPAFLDRHARSEFAR